jgi:general secretion pathway protein H
MDCSPANVGVKPNSRRWALALRLVQSPSRDRGFTLVELLIVLTIIGLVSAAVVLALPDPRGSLVDEAERFAARAHAAQERAITDARPIAIRVTSSGYGFDRRERGEWKPLAGDLFGDRAWSEGTRASLGSQAAQRLAFDTTGATEPTRLLLVRDEEQVFVDIGADGRTRVTR